MDGLAAFVNISVTFQFILWHFIIALVYLYAKVAWFLEWKILVDMFYVYSDHAQACESVVLC